MPIDRFSSPVSAIPRVKSLRSLRQRKYRQREGLFLVEGIRIVEEALDCGAPVETLVYAPDLLVSERARALVERVEPDRRLALSADVFRTLSERDEPQGIAAVVRIQEPAAGGHPAGRRPAGHRRLPVARSGQPGQHHPHRRRRRRDGRRRRRAVGGPLRSAGGAGDDGLAVRPAHRPPGRWGGPGALVRRDAGSRAAAAGRRHLGPRRADPFRRRTIAGRWSLLVGSERHGLPDAVREQADVTVRLPMAGRATSLNVSAAAAALVYEIVRQRRKGTRGNQGAGLIPRQERIRDRLFHPGQPLGRAVGGVGALGRTAGAAALMATAGAESVDNRPDRSGYRRDEESGTGSG